MGKYLLIAREKINGIDNDSDLKKLNGYGEIIVEIPDGKEIADVLDEAIENINRCFPDCKFENFEWKKIS